MCARVHRSATTVSDPWDPRTRTITIPASLTADRALIAVRAVLAELHVPQPDVGATCFCGAPVHVTETLIPQQPTVNSEVMTRGA